MQIFGPAGLTNSTPPPFSSPNSTTSSSASSPPPSTDPLTQESTFLQLLVAQLKNQDPLNPVNSMQYVGQLVQFSQLEQLLGINQNVQKLVANTQPNPGPATSTSAAATQPTH